MKPRGFSSRAFSGFVLPFTLVRERGEPSRELQRPARDKGNFAPQRQQQPLWDALMKGKRGPSASRRYFLVKTLPRLAPSLYLHPSSLSLPFLHRRNRSIDHRVRHLLLLFSPILFFILSSCFLLEPDAFSSLFFANSLKKIKRFF